MIPMNRRNVLSASAALAMSGGSTAQSRQARGAKDFSLKAASPFRMGTCFSSSQFGQPDLVRLLTRNFSQVTPEWQMKMDALQKADGSIDLKDCNSFVRQAADVRRQDIWDRWGPDLAEDWPHLGLIFRRRFCGVASADVRWSGV